MQSPHSTRVRTDESPGVTMDGLLNALDGMLTPHGLITCMTTNHAEVLDPALVRPGRVDLAMEFGYLDADQLRRLLKAFMGRVPDLATADGADHPGRCCRRAQAAPGRADGGHEGTGSTHQRLGSPTAGCVLVQLSQ